MSDATVYFATNRRPKRQRNPDDFSDEIVGDVQSIRFGRAVFRNADLSPDTSDDDLTALGARARIEVAKERLDPEDSTRSRLGSQQVFGWIRDDMRTHRSDLLFYVHGYDYTFRQSVARAAQLQHWYGAKPMAIMLFAWPSLGKGVAPATYKDERQRAAASGAAMGRTILKAADFIRSIPRDERCPNRFHLMAHSMGNWAVRFAVQAMRTFVGDNIPPLIDQALLLAADEDDDTLARSHKMAPLLRGCGRVSVYYNRLDNALKASDWAMGNPDRLGRSGPENPAALPAKITSISTASVIDLDIDPNGHQYYRNNARVRDDLLTVLNGEPQPDIPNRSAEESYYLLLP